MRLRTSKLLVVALSSALLWPLAYLGPSQAREKEPVARGAAETKAFSELSRCLNSKSTLDLLYLVDDSSSMKLTDPDNVRASVLAQNFQQLSAIADKKVNFAVATFGSEFKVRKNWEHTNAEDATETADWLRANVGTWTSGKATDWALALRKSNEFIRTAPDAASGNSCQAIVWFTDGGIRIAGKNGRISNPQTLSGLQDLCGSNPLSGADARAVSSLITQIRKSHVTLLAVLLADKRWLDSLPAKNRAHELAFMSYLRPVVEGIGEVDTSAFNGKNRDKSFTCGQHPIPKTQSSGAIFRADDPKGLAFQFARVISEIKGGDRGLPLVGSPSKIMIDPGIDSFDVLIPGNKWVLKSPAGELIADQSGSKVQRAVALTGEVSTVSVKVSPEDVGQWTLVQPDISIAPEYYLYSGLSINLEDNKLTAGSDASIKGSVKASSGIVDLGVFQSSDLSVTSIDPDSGDGNRIPLSIGNDGKFKGTFTPIGDRSSALFDVTLAVTTQSGIKLHPITTRFEEAVQLPANYPSIKIMKFSDLKGKSGHADAKIVLSGANNYDGKVCLKNARITDDPLPTRIQGYVFSEEFNRNECWAIKAGEQIVTTISISNTTPANGKVGGDLTAVAQSGASPELLSQQLDFSFQSLEISTSPWPIIIAMTLFGIAFAFALFYAMTFRASRLSLEGLTIARIPVSVLLNEPLSKLTRTDKKTDTLLEASGTDGGDFQPISSDLDRVRVWAPPGGAEKISAIVPRNPFGKTRTVVTPATGSFILSMSAPSWDRKTGAAGFELNPANSFYIVVSELALSKDEKSQLATNPMEDGPFAGGFEAESALSPKSARVPLDFGDSVDVEIVGFVSRSSEPAIKNLQEMIQRSSVFSQIVMLSRKLNDSADSKAQAGKSSATDTGRPKSRLGKKQAKAEKVEPQLSAALSKDNPFADSFAPGGQTSNTASGGATSTNETPNPFANDNPFA